MSSAESEYFLSTNIDDDRPALMDDSRASWLSYRDLRLAINRWKQKLQGPKGLVFLYAHNDIESVAGFLGSRAAGHAVALFDPAMSLELRRQLEELYSPDWVIESQQATPKLRLESATAPLHPNLSVLLSTSGSTGSPKLVRLTADNIYKNAQAIGEVLEINSNDVACGHLPLHYSFGLSVLTSHLLHGARIRLTKLGFTDRAFWTAMREAEVTHLPGVPFHFQIMQKLGYRRLNIPTVKSLAQAGGFLNLELRQEAHAYMEMAGGRFYVLYGQTEASPRMTTLTHDAFLRAPESVGKALRGCKICIEGADAKGHGNVEFYGPNVMMGYAECQDDLTRGDDLCGKLLTGDIGFLDKDGMLTLTGRSKRFGKIYGLRVSLDEVETFANLTVEAAVTQQEDTLIFHMVKLESLGENEDRWQILLTALKKRYALPPSSYRAEYVTSIPRTERGKINYAELRTS